MSKRYSIAGACISRPNLRQLLTHFCNLWVKTLKDFKKEVAEFARYLKETPPSEGSTGVLYPGEIEYIREQKRKAEGIEIEDATWDKLKALAGEYNLATGLDLA